MSEKSYLTGNCPKCGAELQIPAELQEFSCMYCGARLNRDALAAQPAVTPQCDAAEAEAAWRAASGKLAGCIRNYPGYNRKILRDEFENAFAEYEAGTRPVFEELNAAVCAMDAGRAELLEQSAEKMLDDLEAAWQADPKWKGKNSRSVIRDDDKIILAIFFVPALRKQKLPISEELSSRIQEKWMQRHPDSPF